MGQGWVSRVEQLPLGWVWLGGMIVFDVLTPPCFLAFSFPPGTGQLSRVAPGGRDRCSLTIWCWMQSGETVLKPQIPRESLLKFKMGCSEYWGSVYSLHARCSLS